MFTKSGFSVFLCCIVMILVGIAIGRLTKPIKIETIYSQDMNPETKRKLDKLEEGMQAAQDQANALLERIKEIDRIQDLGIDFNTD